jgi:hypothetical protein
MHFVSMVIQLNGVSMPHTCKKRRKASTDFREEERSLSLFRMSRIFKPEIPSKRAFSNPKVEAVNPSHLDRRNTR